MRLIPHIRAWGLQAVHTRIYICFLSVARGVGYAERFCLIRSVCLDVYLTCILLPYFFWGVTYAARAPEASRPLFSVLLSGATRATWARHCRPQERYGRTIQVPMVGYVGTSGAGFHTLQLSLKLPTLAEPLPLRVVRSAWYQLLVRRAKLFASTERLLQAPPRCETLLRAARIQKRPTHLSASGALGVLRSVF